MLGPSLFNYVRRTCLPLVSGFLFLLVRSCGLSILPVVGLATLAAADTFEWTDPIDGWEARFGTDLDGGNSLDWQRQLGSGVPLAASQAVPEPDLVYCLFSAQTCTRW